MMFNNLLRLVATASALTVAYGQVLANGQYQIKSVSTGTLARNFGNTEGATTPTLLDFATFDSADASNFVWNITKGAGDSGYTLLNVGSGNTAAVPDPIEGTFVQGFLEVATQFAIESAGNGNFVIKTPNADLLWSVFETNFFTFVPFLDPADGGNEQRFQFIPV